jgi:hypothetical protein
MIEAGRGLAQDPIRVRSVDLIYLDPPFYSNVSYNVLFKAPTGKHSQTQIEAYEDTVRLAMPEIGLFDAIYSARALRRLKPDPVPEEIIARILDAAIRAPSAGNTQNWAFHRGARWRATAPTGRDLPQGLRHRERDVQGARSAGAFDGRAVSALDDFRGIFVGPHG